jgi:hypothetical protein
LLFLGQRNALMLYAILETLDLYPQIHNQRVRKLKASRITKAHNKLNKTLNKAWGEKNI